MLSRFYVLDDQEPACRRSTVVICEVLCVGSPGTRMSAFDDCVRGFVSRINQEPECRRSTSVCEVL